MKASLLAIFVTATTLGLGLSTANAAPAHQHTGNQCVREMDPNCGTVAGPSYGSDMSYRAYDDRSYRVAPTMAQPEGTLTGSMDRCANISGGGSGTPAYLYSECAAENR